MKNLLDVILHTGKVITYFDFQKILKKYQKFCLFSNHKTILMALLLSLLKTFPLKNSKKVWDKFKKALERGDAPAMKKALPAMDKAYKKLAET